jgi:xanthine dehydrogenase large subunit
MNRQTPITPSVLHQSKAHDSAEKQVQGRADYVDDLPEPEGLLHGYFGLSTRAHARIDRIDLAAVLAVPGVVRVLGAKDVPGENDISSVHAHDEPLFAETEVNYWGQPLFLVLATSRDAARRAARLARIDYTDLPAVLDVEKALDEGGKLVTTPLTLQRGDLAEGFAKADARVKGRVRIGGQEHFYLESQIAIALPGEGDEITLQSSTQHPTEIQVMVAQVLGIPHAAVTVNMRRMGGGFGGKETQGNVFAAAAALGAKLPAAR